MAEIRLKILLILMLMAVNVCGQWKASRSRVIEVKGGDDTVVWVVQLSDLHFSVHHPDRALNFRNFVGRFLSIINPSLFLITCYFTVFSSLFFSSISYFDFFFFTLLFVSLFVLWRILMYLCWGKAVESLETMMLITQWPLVFTIRSQSIIISYSMQHKHSSRSPS